MEEAGAPSAGHEEAGAGGDARAAAGAAAQRRILQQPQSLIEVPQTEARAASAMSNGSNGSAHARPPMSQRNKAVVVGGAAAGGMSIGDGAPPSPSLWQRYLNANKTNPLTTKMITTGVLSACGNSAAQGILMSKGKQKGFNVKKLAAFVLFGGFISAPLGHMWLKFLNSRKTGLRGQKLVLFKICMDRLLYGPAFNAVQMSFVYKVSGQSFQQVLKSLQNTFLQAQILNFKMWPFAQYINFNFIPPELQLLYMNFVALIWTVSLSMIMN